MHDFELKITHLYARISHPEENPCVLFFLKSPYHIDENCVNEDAQ